jgi:two-component system, OmpR family, response regulator
MKILLVDDDTFLIDMYAAKFTGNGHGVDTAKSVEEALALLRSGKNTYDAILLDMVLPGMTGLDLLNAVRTEGLLKTSKAIVLSNQGDQTDIDAALAAGANGYIVKAHMIPSEVVARVTAIVEKKES